MGIGEKIKDLRKERGLTQNKLAKDLMLTQDTISRIEKGNREVTNSELVAISKYFNVSADYLLGITEIETSDTDIKAICEYTGLSEEAIRLLGDWENENNSVWFPCKKDFLNMLIISQQGILLCNAADKYKQNLSSLCKIIKKWKSEVLKEQPDWKKAIEIERKILDNYDNVDMRKYKAIEIIIHSLELFAKSELSELEALDDFYSKNCSIIERF